MAAVVGCRGSVEDRFWSRCTPEPMSGCWLWTGALANRRYGSLYKDGRMQKAHRVSYEMHVGPIPDGLDLDHKCRNTICCNPDHLEPVTRAENLRRSPLMDRQSHKTHCPRGHAYDDQNTRYTKKGHRLCKTCMRQHIRNWRARNAKAN